MAISAKTLVLPRPVYAALQMASHCAVISRKAASTSVPWSWSNSSALNCGSNAILDKFSSGSLGVESDGVGIP
jgi:hypothetical protein